MDTMLAFESLSSALTSSASLVSHRSEGAGFLRALKPLYGLDTVNYCCVNMHDKTRSQYAHCLFSDTSVAHYVSQSCIKVTRVGDTERRTSLQSELTLWPRARLGETAALC